VRATGPAIRAHVAHDFLIQTLRRGRQAFRRVVERPHRDIVQHAQYAGIDRSDLQEQLVVELVTGFGEYDMRASRRRAVDGRGYAAMRCSSS
jgi:hypothetical protein